MTTKRSPIAGYCAWLLAEYNKAKKQTSPPTLYRLIEIKEKEKDCYRLSFQLLGRAIVFKATPENILKNEKIIECFSSKDIRIITELACKKSTQPKNKIIAKIFSEKLNRLLFRTQNLNQEIVDNTATELAMNKAFIRDLSPEDAYMLGYTIAHEMQKEEKRAIRQVKS